MGTTKTFFLMTGLTLLFMYIGELSGGEEGLMQAFWMACGINFFSYFFSDKLVLAHYKAVEIKEKDNSIVYPIVQRLVQQAGLPMPKVYVIPDPTPNAFATGRNPSHAAVAVNEGLLQLLTPEEIEGVLAHEISHIKHRDILISSVAATLVGAITCLIRMSQSNRLTGQRSSSNPHLSSFGGIGLILGPIAASIIQMTISRTREYAADAGAAHLTGHPEWLMQALSKLDGFAQQSVMKRATPATAHLFIVNPLKGLPRSIYSLFSTHPSTKDRIERLAEIKKNL